MGDRGECIRDWPAPGPGTPLRDDLGLEVENRLLKEWLTERPLSDPQPPATFQTPRGVHVAVMAGRDPHVSSERVLIMAHGDHVDIDEPSNGDAIYNGAVDNASAVGALLEIARTLAARPPARSVVLLCTTGEEQGLIGARDDVRAGSQWSRVRIAVIAPQVPSTIAGRARRDHTQSP